MSYLGEGAVVPDVTFVGKAVADEAELAFLRVLLDGVESLFFGDLDGSVVSLEHPMACRSVRCEGGVSRRTSCLALLHRGISTTMFSTVCCSLAYSGISWNGDTGTPSFSR